MIWNSGYVDVGHYYDDLLGIYAEDRPASTLAAFSL